MVCATFLLNDGVWSGESERSFVPPVVPAGLGVFCVLNPQLKLWAIVYRPCGTGQGGGFYPVGYFRPSLWDWDVAGKTRRAEGGVLNRSKLRRGREWWQWWCGGGG